MKAKFRLGFLSGYDNVDNAWPGSRHLVPLLEPMQVAPSASVMEVSDTRIKCLVFECRTIDDDRAAVFDFLEVR